MYGIILLLWLQFAHPRHLLIYLFPGHQALVGDLYIVLAILDAQWDYYHL